MFDSPVELLEKIQLREDTYLEVKEVRFAGQRVTDPHRNSFADTIATFANTRGGVFVLGVDNKTYDVVGIPLDRLELVSNFIREVCNDSLVPPLETFVVEHLRLPSYTGEELAVIKVDVPQSLFVHRSPGGYLHRVGNAKRAMSTEYLARLSQQRSQTRLIRFDEQTVKGASFADLEPELIERFRIDGAQDDQQTLARKLGMAMKLDSGELHPTVTGVLLGINQQTPWLPHAYIQAVAYRGRNVPESMELEWYQLDASDLTGPLDRQIFSACQFVVRNQMVYARKEMGRMDQPQYDMTAVFEAVVNAVAHRDYSMSGTRIRLHMFSDRIELYSPGELPNTMTVDDLAYRQSSRNETLTSLLARCPVPEGVSGLETPRTFVMDRRGNGVPVILEKSEKLSGKRPVYDMLGEAELRLTIYAAEPDLD